MQGHGFKLRRINLPRTSVNRAEKKMGRGYWTPAPRNAIPALSRLRVALHRDA
jgi:hypothetical protein